MRVVRQLRNALAIAFTMFVSFYPAHRAVSDSMLSIRRTFHSISHGFLLISTLLGMLSVIMQ